MENVDVFGSELINMISNDLNINRNLVDKQEFCTERNTILSKEKRNTFLSLYEVLVVFSSTAEKIYYKYSDNNSDDLILSYSKNNIYRLGYRKKKDEVMEKYLDYLVLLVMVLPSENICKLIKKYCDLYDLGHFCERYYSYIADKPYLGKRYLLYLISGTLFMKAEESKKRQSDLENRIKSIKKIMSEDFHKRGDEIYKYTFGIKAEDDVRICLLERASDLHHVQATFDLAEYYKNCENGKKRKENCEKIIALYEDIEEYDDSGRAAWALGEIYYKGELLQGKDLKRAKKYYNISSKKGYAKADNSLGNICVDCFGSNPTNENIAKAIRFYKKAAEQRYTYAYINLGHMYGLYMHDLKQAEDYYKMASEDNSQIADYFLVKLYLFNRSEFNEYTDDNLLESLWQMTKYRNNFKYTGKVYEHIAQLLQQNRNNRSIQNKVAGYLETERTDIDYLIYLLYGESSKHGNDKFIETIDYAIRAGEKMQAKVLLDFAEERNLSEEDSGRCVQLRSQLQL